MALVGDLDILLVALSDTENPPDYVDLRKTAIAAVEDLKAEREKIEDFVVGLDYDILGETPDQGMERIAADIRALEAYHEWAGSLMEYVKNTSNAGPLWELIHTLASDDYKKIET